MRYVSVCSGMEAASVAWHRLGWTCLAVAEIDPYCCSLLNQHYGASRPRYMPLPSDADNEQDAVDRKQAIKRVAGLPVTGLPNLGDITQADPSEFKGITDVLVGGTPCVGFSVAGLRKSLGDRRNLTQRFIQYADAIDPRYILWENVPGVLNTADNAFGCFLGGLVGADAALVPPKGLRWTSSGVVDGPKRSAAWRIFDAQYSGLAQRRERVFVVASSRDAAHAGEIVFEREGMQRHSAPRRETWEATSGTLTARTKGGGGLGTDFEIGEASTYDVAPALTASGRGVERSGDSRGQDPIVAVMR